MFENFDSTGLDYTVCTDEVECLVEEDPNVGSRGSITGTKWIGEGNRVGANHENGRNFCPVWKVYQLYTAFR